MKPFYFFTIQPNIKHSLNVFFSLTILVQQHELKVIGLCRTRWVECHEAYENFFELAPAIVMTTDMMAHPHLYDDAVADWPWDKETKEKANSQMV